VKLGTWAGCRADSGKSGKAERGGYLGYSDGTDAFDTPEAAKSPYRNEPIAPETIAIKSVATRFFGPWEQTVTILG
jgi:hypothetical protein